ncbi:hypothetical protein ACHAWO_013358 [Cyclotella atomus]|uniref:Uncharacterized protein n=1 Tax=Cyclotella atomus TaxID=382360 RepID=A0ABD3P5W4_9STRA
MNIDSNGDGNDASAPSSSGRKPLVKVANSAAQAAISDSSNRSSSKPSNAAALSLEEQMMSDANAAA